MASIPTRRAAVSGAAFSRTAPSLATAPRPPAAFSFSGNETGIPYLQTTSVAGGTIGNPYASFLLGGADSASVSNISDPQFRRTGWAMYVQDTWKVAPRLTLDYGLRWDYESYGHEEYYRESNFDPNLPNPSAGGLPGATQYEGYGAGRCNCTFAHTYPFAFGPRLGMAYQITPKTVLRAGWGIAYGQTPGTRLAILRAGIGVGFNTLNFTLLHPMERPALVVLGQGLKYSQAADRMPPLTIRESVPFSRHRSIAPPTSSTETPGSRPVSINGTSHFSGNS